MIQPTTLVHSWLESAGKMHQMQTQVDLIIMLAYPGHVQYVQRASSFRDSNSVNLDPERF